MPNRILKESICLSEQIDSLTWYEEVVFYRLIVNCDDYGRFDGRISVIKSRLFALKENLTHKQISDAIGKLASIGLVVLYEYEGKPFLYLPTWNEHQNVRAKKSKYPEPEKQVANICMQMNTNDFKCSRNPIQSESNPIRISNADADNAHEATATADESFGEIMKFYMDNINASVSPLTAQKMADWLTSVDASLVRYAISQAVDHDKRTWAYINAIIDRHFKAGRLTEEAAKQEAERRDRNKKSKEPEKKPSRYNFEELQRQAFMAVNGVTEEDLNRNKKEALRKSG